MIPTKGLLEESWKESWQPASFCVFPAGGTLGNDAGGSFVAGLLPLVGRLGGVGEPAACHRCLPGLLSPDPGALSQKWASARSSYPDGLPEMLTQ